MAHFAKISQNGVVENVIVFNGEGVDGEAACSALFGGTWKQTSYNGTIRKNFAGIGMIYDSQRDAFLHQQPYPSWILNEETCQWVSPMPKPDEAVEWNEDELRWVKR